MPLTLRILLGFLVVGGISFYVLLDRVMERMERQYFEAAEDPMVDAAFLLAAAVGEDAIVNAPDVSWSSRVEALATVNPNARIFSKLKDRVEMDFYVTDRSGRVLFDSSGSHQVGADYSAFYDVFLTLRGAYGARSSRVNPDDDQSSVMYVGAPIWMNDEIVGVLTVYKSQRSLRIFIQETRRVLYGFAILALTAMLAGGLLASRWITAPMRALTGYIREVAAGKKPRRPKFASRSMESLAVAFESMRDAVEGRDAIESYVQTLTHEMKSPVAAIRGAAELLGEPMPEAQRDRFLENIRIETERLSNLTERLLALASLERCKQLQDLTQVDVNKLVHENLSDLEPAFQNKRLKVLPDLQSGCELRGDAGLLRMAIGNLIQNAVDFSPTGSTIEVKTSRQDEDVVIEVMDRGDGIPPYAVERAFERFFSMPRSDNGKKSTGLGLCFVRETAMLHGGSAGIGPREGGGTRVVVRLRSV